MSQATTSSVPASPASSPAVIDYNAYAPPRKSSWLNLRVLLFVLVFGGIIGWVTYVGISSAMTGGVVLNKDGYYEVDLKSISLFPLDQQNGATADIPERIRALDGKKVVLVGEMWAGNSAGSAVGGFDLCYSIAKCCFSGPPQAQHFVKSTPSQKGVGLPMYDGLVRVKGTLSVGVVQEAGKVQSVYRLSVDSLDPI
ncbi:MAG: hypothetical protein JWM57_47 [Phycisphaerales bacterium]|nr:hypothetical protein [Phycisphaerales bacterium]